MGQTLLRLAAGAAGGALALAVAAPAYADTTIDINPDHLGATAGGFEEQECDGPFEALPDGVDGWHFVLPAATGDNFVSLTLEFEEQSATITSNDVDNPTVDGEVAGYFDNAGSNFRHAYVFTSAGWTLTNASAVVEGEADGTFNLSHTCAGVPGATPPPSPTPTPSVTPSPGEEGDDGEDDGEDNGEGGGNGGEDDELPVTGSQVSRLLGAGAVLLVAGGGLATAVTMLTIRRRRQLAEMTDA